MNVLVVRMVVTGRTAVICETAVVLLVVEAVVVPVVAKPVGVASAGSPLTPTPTPAPMVRPIDTDTLGSVSIGVGVAALLIADPVRVV